VSSLSCILSDRGISISFPMLISRSIVLSAWFEVTSMTFSIVFDKHAFIGLISTSSSSSSIYDSTEIVIQELIDECQRSIDEQYDNSLAANEYLKHKMKTLQNAPRDLKKLEKLLKTKERECRKAKYSLDIESLVAEIEVLRVIRYLINRNDNDRRTPIMNSK
jgi:hypothetical protein